MAELEPLKKISKEPEKVQEVKKQEPEQDKKTIEKEIERQSESFDLLRKVNGELFFELEFATGKLIVSEGKCNQLIPEFKKMTSEQKETFLMQAAIFGANPFSVPAEIYPVPFDNQDGSKTYAPVINYKKYIDFGAANPRFDGMKSGIIVETSDGNIINRSGQVRGSKETLIGGWCEVYVKGIKEPIFKSVNLNEFEQRTKLGVLTKFWDPQKGKPSLMIEKIACKLAFEIAMKMPKTYVEEELPVMDVEHEDLTSQKAISANNKEFFETK